MQSAQWIEQSHLIMSCGGTLYVLYLLLLYVAYYVLYRKGATSRVFAWSVSKLRPRFKWRFVAPLLGGALTFGLLLLPFVVGGLLMLLAARLMNSHYRDIDPAWLSWGARNYSSWLKTLLGALIVFVPFAALDAYTHWPVEVPKVRQIPNNWLTRLVSKVSDYIRPVTSALRRAGVWCASTKAGAAVTYYISIIRELRRRASLSAPYRLLFQTVLMLVLFSGVHSLWRAGLLPGEAKVAPLPESARKATILALAKEVGVDELTLQIKQVSWRTRAMNADGRNKVFGARIRYTDTLWDGQNDDEVTSTTGHELFHVLHSNFYEDLALFCLILLGIPCLLIGPPKKEGGSKSALLSRAPRCALVLLLCWPAHQIGLNALQRPYEAQADVFSVQLTVPGRVSLEAAKSSLIKVDQSSGLDPNPFWLFKHLFYDHPPLFERLRNIEEAVRQQPAETVKN
jgi:Zn-dependent protease with chaperone function